MQIGDPVELIPIDMRPEPSKSIAFGSTRRHRRIAPKKKEEKPNDEVKLFQRDG